MILKPLQIKQKKNYYISDIQKQFYSFIIINKLPKSIDIYYNKSISFIVSIIIVTIRIIQGMKCYNYNYIIIIT